MTKEYIMKYSALSEKEKKILSLIVLLQIQHTQKTLLAILQKCFTEIKAEDISAAITKFKRKDLVCSDGICNEEFWQNIIYKIEQQSYFPILAQQAYSFISKDTNQNDHMESCISLLRLAVVMKDLVKFEQVKENIELLIPNFFAKHNHLVIISNAFPIEWITTLPAEMQIYIINDVFKSELWYLEPVSKAWLSLLDKYCFHDNEYSYLMRQQKTNLLFLQQGLSAALQFSEEDWKNGLAYALFYKGIQLFLQKKYDLAWKNFENAIAAYAVRHKTVFMEDFYGFFALSCLLMSSHHHLHDNWEELVEYMRAPNQEDSIHSELCKKTYAIKYLQENDINKAEILLVRGSFQLTPLCFFFVVVLCHWVNKEFEINKNSIQQLFQLAKKNNYGWIAANLFPLLSVKDDELAKHFSSYSNTLLDLQTKQEKWEKALDQLAEIIDIDSEVEESENKRLAWFIKPRNINAHSYDFYIKEQKLSANDIWSPGRKMEISQVVANKYLTPIDEKIINLLRGTSERNDKKVLAVMAEHPYVFLEKSGEKINICLEEPELMVTKTNKNFIVEFPYEISLDNIVCIWEGDRKLRVICFTEKHMKIAQIVKNKIFIPLDQEDRLLSLTKNIAAQINVFSEIDGIGNITPVDAPIDIYVRFTRYADYYFHIEFVVKPLDEEEYVVFPPGKGAQKLSGILHKTQSHVYRNFTQEEEKANQLAEICLLSPNEDWHWTLDLKETLQVLQELNEQPEVKMEWPQGQKIKIKKRIGEKDVSLRVRKERDWFSINGEVNIDDQLIWDIKQILPFLEQGSFIKLTDDTFVTLTQELKKKLDELANLTRNKEDDFLVHSAMIPTIDEVLQGFDEVKYAKEWKKQLKRIEKIKTTEQKLPTHFNATLRDYQHDGFQWLNRMQEWGVGACLADDMGLGKTIQAITILLTKASVGPSLVVAPTSVCLNWEIEIKKFSPSLNPIVLSTQTNSEVLSQLKAYDIAITSYGILQHREAFFVEVSWNVVILDEAQAIKNMQSKRSQAVMKLPADFRLATTGTPIENNLTELWTLFQFINPGLLGSFDTFRKNFILPIERDHCGKTMQYLQKIVSNFILRRTKKEVLTELPEKIEKTLLINMEKEEAAFYEAVRQRSLEVLSHLSDKKSAQRIQILAEITKLRRACCHPRLIHPESKIESSKLATFDEIIQELLDNKQKILVFSQFVQYLKIVEKFLQEKKFSYLYLDGSTPQKQRQKRVEAFQNDEAHLFLISLKAGGVGLNLTRASVVIHLDPWWNPAVEDQATDRAHRIGQDKIVTVYRLVTKNTIEQKILGLHEEKRDLASKILEGSSDANKSLDVSSLIQLFSDEEISK